MENTPENTEKPDSADNEVESSDLLASILNLSDEAKRWLYHTCSCFEDGCGYTGSAGEMAECMKAGLLTVDQEGWMDLSEGVFDTAYSDGKAKVIIS